MKNIIDKTPRGRALKNRFLKGFNPAEPSSELTALLDEESMPNSGYLNPDTRGVKITELKFDQLEWIAFVLRNGTEKMKLLCTIKYFIDLYKRLDEEGMSVKEYRVEVGNCFPEHKVFILNNLDEHLTKIGEDW